MPTGSETPKKGAATEMPPHPRARWAMAALLCCLRSQAATAAAETAASVVAKDCGIRRHDWTANRPRGWRPGRGVVANRKDSGPQAETTAVCSSVPQASKPGTARVALLRHICDPATMKRVLEREALLLWMKAPAASAAKSDRVNTAMADCIVVGAGAGAGSGGRARRAGLAEFSSAF